MKGRFWRTLLKRRKKDTSTEVKEALEILAQAFKDDKGYLDSWTANIAMSFVDESAWHRKATGKPYLSASEIHIIANKAAESFIAKLIG